MLASYSSQKGTTLHAVRGAPSQTSAFAGEPPEHHRWPGAHPRSAADPCNTLPRPHGTFGVRQADPRGPAERSLSRHRHGRIQRGFIIPSSSATMVEADMRAVAGVANPYGSGEDATPGRSPPMPTNAKP